MKETTKGSLLITLSAVMYGSYGVWSKLMGDSFGSFNQAWTRALLLLAVLIPVGLILKNFRKIQKKDIGWFALISIIGGANQAPYYYAFQELSVGTATLLFYVALTIGAYLFGWLGFKEKITLHKLIALALGMAGLLVIFTLELHPGQFLAGGAALLAGLMGSVFVIFSKKLSGNYSEIQIISIDLIAVLLINIPLSMAFSETIPSISDSTAWLSQIGYAASFLIANIAVIAGMKRLEPSVGGIIGLSEVVFAAVFGVVLFSEPVTLSLMVGGFLILLSAGWNDLSKMIQPKK